MFKIYALEEDDLVEKANLRAGKNPNLNFSCNDVVWNPIEGNIGVKVVRYCLYCENSQSEHTVD